MLRMLAEAKAMSGAAAIDFRNHRRLAKKRARAIVYTRGKDKKARLYRDLIKATSNTLGYLEQAKISLALTSGASLQAEQWHA